MKNKVFILDRDEWVNEYSKTIDQEIELLKIKKKVLEKYKSKLPERIPVKQIVDQQEWLSMVRTDKDWIDHISRNAFQNLPIAEECERGVRYHFGGFNNNKWYIEK